MSIKSIFIIISRILKDLKFIMHYLCKIAQFIILLVLHDFCKQHDERLVLDDLILYNHHNLNLNDL
jgi:hypothetical protein